MKIRMMCIAIFSVSSLVAQENTLMKFDTPEKLPAHINSTNGEEGLPLVTADGNTLFFIRSFHPENTGGSKAGQDIWYSEKNTDGSWAPASNKLNELNNIDNNAVVGISPNGYTVYLHNVYLNNKSEY